MIHQIDLRIKNMESQLAMLGAQQHEGGMSKYKPHHADEERCQNRSPTMQERVAWPSQGEQSWGNKPNRAQGNSEAHWFVSTAGCRSHS